MSLRQSYQNHKAAYIAGAVGLVLIVAGIVYFTIGRSKAPKIVTATVRRGDINSAVQATGTINPLTTVSVGSYVSGTVKYIFADFDSRVESGQVLAQIDPAIYEAQLVQAQGNLKNAQANMVTLAATVQVDEANLAKSKANAKYETATATRSQNLFKFGVASSDSNDQIQSTLGQALAQVQADEASVEQAKAQLAQGKTQIIAMQGALTLAERNLAYTTIISPIDGTVVARNIDVGQSVAATLQAPTVFTVAQDLKRMQVYAATDESDTGSITVGTPVTFQVDAYPTEQFHGRVSAVRLNATTVQNVVTYNTVIDFENPTEKLLPGETAYVTIPTGHASNAVQIPNGALTYAPALSHAQFQALYDKYDISHAAAVTHLGGWQVVWKPAPKNQAIPVAVQCGITDFTNTQLVQGNLHEGDVLITGDQTALAAARPNGGFQ